LVNWSGGDEDVGERRILSSDPHDLVNDCRLGPTDLKVLVETTSKADAFLWRPATKMFTMEEVVGQIIACRATKCVLLDKEIQIEDIGHLVNFLLLLRCTQPIYELVFAELFSKLCL